MPYRRYRSRLSSSARPTAFWRSSRYRRTPQPWRVAALIVLGVAVFVLLVAAAVWAIDTIRDRKPRPAVKAPVVAAAPAKPVVRAPLKPGPAALQASLDQIAKRYGETIGIAVADVDAGWATSVNGHAYFPQQSVSKVWVAATVLEAVDHGKLALDTPVLMTSADASVFNQPLARNLPPEGFRTTVSNLLRHALAYSDNSANDALIRVIGLSNVRAMLERQGLSGIRLGADERHLQSMIAGLTWRPEYGQNRNFEQARAKLPRDHREKAMDAYIAAPADGATPLGLVQALAAIKRGEVLSPASRDVLLGMLASSRTGPGRLKGSLPSGWKIAHKTGTGQDLLGASVGINDVAILTAPDGQSFAVAVLIPRTKKPVRERLAMMQAVTSAVAQAWREGAKPQP